VTSLLMCWQVKLLATNKAYRWSEVTQPVISMTPNHVKRANYIDLYHLRY